MPVRDLPLMLALLVVGAAAAQARDAPTSYRAEVEARFRAWREAEVWPAARAQGVPRAVYDRALGRVELDWSLPDLVPPGRPAPPGAEGQAEFASPGAYLAEARLAVMTRTGKALLARWKDTLDAVERRTGVPREIVVAIWGRESSFGSAAPRASAFRVLATQAFMGRRKDLYGPELVAALRLAAQGAIAPEEMRSSWAGAMGQPQFLPSKILRSGLDFDGDGRADIWRSVPDTLASIANYLAHEGWRADRGWGFEVELPPGVPCTLEGPDKGRPLAAWERLGARRLRPGPGGPGGPERRAFLLMPAGRLGPAFLVSENFYVLKKYNESDLYALFIGDLADRLRGEGGIAGAWAPVSGFKRREVRAMQERLVAKGHDVGRVDGLVGYATRVAIGRWQRDNGLAETCFPTAELVRTIR